MATVNVNRGLTDQFYRYKMPKIQAKVEGKGNGIKTVIVNMVDVAKALNRPPMYPTKYFGCILGAQVNYDNKNDRYIVNGSHDAAKLQDLLDGFISKYVLCANCKNPETVLKIQAKKSIISTTCKACGHTGLIAAQDKLSTFILKYPVEELAGNNGTATAPVVEKKDPKIKGEKKEKKDKKKKENRDTNGQSSPRNGDSDENDQNGNRAPNDEEDEEWCEDTDENAVAKRMEELSMGAKGLMHTNDLEKSSEERLEIFFAFIKVKKESVTDAFDVITQKEIVAEADRLEIRDKAVLALCELLFTGNILSDLKTHRLLFIRFTNENPKAVKYLMRGVELTIKLYEKELLAKVPLVLKAMYDLDIVDEGSLLEWGAKPSRKTVGKELALAIHEKAAPFIKWLKEAEEDSTTDEEDSDEDDAIEFNDRIIGTGIITQESPKKPINGSVPAVNGSAAKPAADDIDIDAI